MVTTAPVRNVPPQDFVPTADQRVVMWVDWEGFEAILAARGERSRPRVTYLKGVLEIMSPSGDHETIKKYFAVLLEEYLDHTDLPYQGVGSWLLKLPDEDLGVEPDECYVLGDVSKSRPDLAIEVEWTSGGLDKLEIYRALGVTEVWWWRKNKTHIFVLGEGGYEERTTSSLLPAFDFTLIPEILRQPTLRDARKFARQTFDATRPPGT